MTTTLHGWTPLSAGKVRDIYAPDEAVIGPAPQTATPAGRPRHAKAGPEALLMVTSDRISAYDYVLPTLIPGKGAVLNQLAIWWMGQLRPLVENHLLAVGTKAPAEASHLEEPIFTPAAKAELGEHDENITFEQTVERIGEELATAIRDLSIALYRAARDIAAERGIIIADTKFEFGIDVTTGALVLADEILTPDSSRFWPADQWVEGQVAPSFDKQYVRDWLVSDQSGWDRASGANPPALPESVAAATAARYVEAYRRLTGSDPIL